MLGGFLIARITDLHIGDRFARINPLKGDTRELLSRTVDYLNELVALHRDYDCFGRRRMLPVPARHSPA